MRYLFRVTVPFIPVARKSLTSSAATNLPSNEVALPGMLVRQIDQGRYAAIVEVEFSDPGSARQFGVIAVEEFLKVLAVSGDRFEIGISSVTAESLGQVSADASVPVHSGNTISITVSDTVFVSGHLRLVKQKADLEFERKALECFEKWPEHIRRGIDLNYSVVRGATDEVKFLLSASALEVLTWKKLGARLTLPKSKLEPSDYELFRQQFEELARSWGFKEDEVTRLRNNLLATHKKPVAHHLLNYLKSVNISNFSVGEVRSWWRIRSRLAHGNSVDEEKLQQALHQITQAVQRALREELTVIS